jgi:folylpolyglutamate synthase/dihydropteroate synthase
MAALGGSLKNMGLAGLTCVFGAMKDKDTTRMLIELSTIVSTFLMVAPATPRATTSRNLCALARRLGLDARNAGSVAAGIKLAASLLPRARPILVTGSHYVVGEAAADFHIRKA